MTLAATSRERFWWLAGDSWWTSWVSEVGRTRLGGLRSKDVGWVGIIDVPCVEKSDNVSARRRLERCCRSVGARSTSDELSSEER